MIKNLLLLPLFMIFMTSTSFSQLLWSEDFANGIPATWSNVTVSGPVDWKYTTVGSSGAFPTAPINSTTEGNGWIIIDSDGDNFSGGGAEDSQLTTDVIDLSGNPNAIYLTFQQNMREWQADTCTVRVTADGGSTWTDWEINNGIGQVGTPNPELQVIDISAAISSNPANVQIQFWWKGAWDYGWQIDDINIYNCLPIQSPAVTVSSCTSHIGPDGAVYDSTGIYLAYVSAPAGCDNIITTDFTLLPNPVGSMTASECSPYTSPSGNYTWTTPGIYMDTVLTQAGCDSVLTIDLSIIPSTTSSIEASACLSYTSPSGNYTWTTSGLYTDVITNAAGCDSTISIDLSIVNIGIGTTTSGATITATATGDTYQWIDCGNGNSFIAGETNQSYTATVAGDYAVIMYSGNCEDTSACTTIVFASLDEQENDLVTNMYPNPSNSVVHLELSEFLADATISVIDMSGRMVQSIENFNGQYAELDVRKLEKGMYTVRIMNRQVSGQHRLIKN